MKKFQMTCACGDVMSVEAENRNEAVAAMKAMMTQEAVDAHITQKHPGEQMSIAEVHSGIDQGLQEAI